MRNLKHKRRSGKGKNPPTQGSTAKLKISRIEADLLRNPNNIYARKRLAELKK